MSDPNQLAADTHRTQDALAGDVTRLTDRVNPQRFVGTRRDKVAQGLAEIKDRVMGMGSSAAQAAKDGAHSAADSAQNATGNAGSAPDAVKGQAQGNPVAAGLIAFGAGWLLSSLIPASDAEQKAAARVEDRAGGVTESVKQSAQEVADNLKEPAQDAVRSVQDTAQEAAHRTSEHAQQATTEVRDHAKDATADVSDNISGDGASGGHPDSIGGHYAG